jgi:hypothetical protein
MVMSKDLADYDLTEFTSKFIGQVQQQRQLGGIAREFDCNGAASIQLPIFTVGMVAPYALSETISDSGGDCKIVQIDTDEFCASRYLSDFALGPGKFSYATAVEDTQIPLSVATRMDQTIIDALNNATGVQTINADSGDLLALFAESKEAMDGQALGIPTEDRFLILPMAAMPLFFVNGELAGNHYIQQQIDNIADGKIGCVMGMRLIFLDNIPSGGLSRTIIDGGANLCWTCYAVAKSCLGQALGYGTSRKAYGGGGIFRISDVPERCATFIGAPFACGAKVLIPEGIVRFHLVTKNYQRNAEEN